MRQTDILASSKKIKRKRTILKATLVLCCFLIFLIGISALFYIPKFRIQNIDIPGSTTLDDKAVSSNIFNSLAGRYFGIFPRDNIFIVPKEQMAKSLLLSFPRVKAVSVERSFPNTIVVRISERKPVALYCQGGEKMEDCDFVDGEAIVFEDAPFFSGNVYVKFYESRASGEFVNKGEQILDQKQFNKMLKLVGSMMKANLQVSKIVLKNEGQYEFYTTEGWRILLNKDNDLLLVFANLKLALEEQIKDKRPDLIYIDFRFGKKVYYKFK